MKGLSFSVGLIVVGLCLASALGAQDSEQKLAALPGTIAATQTAPTIQQPFQMNPDLTPPEVPDSYRVGVNDLLAIFVYQMPELTSQVRVDSAGGIRLPMLPQALPIRGLTAPQISRILARDLQRHGLARDPVVRVVVRQVLSRPIVVAGAVAKPVVIQATRPLRLVEALTRAGGPDTKDAGTEVLVTSSGATGQRTQQFSLRQIMNSADPSADPLLTGGEVVRVLPARYVYAVGALQKPNAFAISANRPMTVLSVLALAQGTSTTRPANTKHCEIIRTVDGRRTAIPVNLKAMLHHAQPDLPLQAGDIFFVPTSTTSKLLDAALGMMSQAAMIAIGYRAF